MVSAGNLILVDPEHFEVHKRFKVGEFLDLALGQVQLGAVFHIFEIFDRQLGMGVCEAHCF